LGGGETHLTQEASDDSRPDGWTIGERSARRRRRRDRLQGAWPPGLDREEIGLRPSTATRTSTTAPSPSTLGSGQRRWQGDRWRRRRSWFVFECWCGDPGDSTTAIHETNSRWATLWPRWWRTDTPTLQSANTPVQAVPRTDLYGDGPLG